MFKNKNYKIILGIVVGMILSVSVVVYAATYYGQASDLSYTNTTSGLSSTNVQDAIEELYNMRDEVICPEGYTCEKKKYLIEHIRSLYTNNVSSTPTDTGNGTYYYANSVQLMNDGLDSTGTEITDTTSLLAGTSGNIRYYGASPNNYIYFNCDTYPDTNCEKWRIIGIVDGKVKIIRGEQIGEYSWDYTSTGEFDNNWNDATIMTLLNDGYYYSKDNISYYNGNKTPMIINFATGTVKGITESTRTKGIIDIDATWYTNGVSSDKVYPNVVYKKERTGTSTWSGAIALAYPSDYGYAADLNSCKQNLFNYGNTSCISVNWMKNINGFTRGWLLTSGSLSQNVWYVKTDGGTLNGNYSCEINDPSILCIADQVDDNNYIMPVLYLNSELLIGIEGNGSSDNPYRISIS